MSRDPMNDILDAAGELFRSSFRQVDIEEFFADRDIPLADGNSKRTFARNTLASLPGERALELILEVATSQSDYGLQDAVYAIQDAGKPEISEITRKRLAGILGTRIHGEGARPEVLAGLFSLESFADLLTGERGDVSLVGCPGEQPAVIDLRRPDGASARMRRLDLGRAALSVLSSADRRLDGRANWRLGHWLTGRLGAVSLAGSQFPALNHAVATL